MKTRIKEESVIFISVFKWLVLATIIGIIVGFSTTVFVSSLNWGARFVSSQSSYYFLAAPAGLFLSAIILKYIFPQAEGHGANKVIESIHKASGKLKPIFVPVEFIRTFLTLTSGCSAGKEGPSAQIGAGLASMFADIFKFSPPDRRKLVICGISGGFASVFGTPIAGAIFGIEVLFAGSIMYDVLLPSFVAGIVSYQVSSSFGLTYFYHPIDFVPVFSEAFFIKVVVAGIFFGIVSLVLIEILKSGKRISAALKMPLHVKALIGGALIIALTFIFSKDYLGLGIETMERALGGGDVPWYAFLLKAVFTSITLNFGGSGGIGTPIFFVGATSGSFLSTLLEVDRSMLAAIGFVSLLAGAANTPIAASIMAVELFGSEVAPYAAIACVISFIVTGHRSAYSAQVLAISKSASIDVELGKELDTADPKIMKRSNTIIYGLSALKNKINEILKKPK